MEDECEKLRKEIHRLQKVNAALMGRVERSVSSQGSSFALFEKNINLGNLVRERTVELQKINDELLRDRVFLQSVYSSMKEGMFLIQPDETATFFNMSALRVLGYSGDDPELMEKSAHDLIHPNGDEYRPCPIRMALTDGKEHSGSDRFWKKDGTSIPVTFSCSPMRVKDALYGTLVTFSDQTELRELEKSLETERIKAIQNSKLASLGEMSAGIAHEINNPLAIIAGSLQVLRMCKDDPDKLNAKLESIQKACDRISRIVLSLKKFSRSGDKTNRSIFAISDILKEVLVLTESKSTRFNTPVTMEVQSTSKIECDEVEIEQVLVNLINNAIDAVAARPEKWVKILIADEGSSVLVRITDSGPGISKEVRDKIFQPFFTTKKVGEGTGLGLSIAKGIVDEHKGTLTILSSSPNTCFEIRLPKAI